MCLGAGVKTAGVHGRHGVVEKKQSEVGNNGWIGKRMCCWGRVCGIIVERDVERRNI